MASTLLSIALLVAGQAAETTSSGTSIAPERAQSADDFRTSRKGAKGVELTRACQSSLKQAEQRVEILLQKNPEAAPEPFEPEE